MRTLDKLDLCVCGHRRLMHEKFKIPKNKILNEFETVTLYPCLFAVVDRISYICHCNNFEYYIKND